MKIEIFGTGCAKCEKTAREVERVARDLGVDATVEHVTDMREIVARVVMMTPAGLHGQEEEDRGQGAQGL